jgi:hypothetical protein
MRNRTFAAKVAEIIKPHLDLQRAQRAIIHSQIHSSAVMSQSLIEQVLYSADVADGDGNDKAGNNSANAKTLFDKAIDNLLKQIADLDAEVNDPFKGGHDYQQCYKDYKDAMKIIMNLVIKKAKALQAKGDSDPIKNASIFYKQQFKSVAEALQKCLRMPKPKKTNAAMSGLGFGK